MPPTSDRGFVLRGGSVEQSSKKGLSRQLPHSVVLTKGFCIDADEVTVGHYKECVDAGVCAVPRIWGIWINYPTKTDHPLNKVDWRQSRAYCKWRGGDLPTEAQWEWAATGGDGRAFAWGNEPPTCERANYTPGVRARPASGEGCDGGGTAPVGSHPAGDRVWPSGRIHDLTGNVWEWCVDNYEPFPGGDEVDPVHMRDVAEVHVIRGGAWNRSEAGIRADYRGGARVDYQVPGLGFRCVRNP